MNPSMLTATLLKTAPSRAAVVVRVVVVVGKPGGVFRFRDLPGAKAQNKRTGAWQVRA